MALVAFCPIVFFMSQGWQKYSTPKIFSKAIFGSYPPQTGQTRSPPRKFSHYRG